MQNEKNPPMVVHTGGEMEVRVSGYNPFSAYAYRLANFREELVKKSISQNFDLNDLLSEFAPLETLCAEIFEQWKKKKAKNFYTDNRNVNTLIDYLLRPLSRFFSTVDIQLKTDYFEKYIDNIAEAVRRREIKIQGRKLKGLNKIKCFFSDEYSDKTMTKETPLTENRYNCSLKIPAFIYYDKRYYRQLNNAKTHEEVKEIINNYYANNSKSKLTSNHNLPDKN